MGLENPSHRRSLPHRSSRKNLSPSNPCPAKTQHPQPPPLLLVHQHGRLPAPIHSPPSPETTSQHQPSTNSAIHLVPNPAAVLEAGTKKHPPHGRRLSWRIRRIRDTERYTSKFCHTDCGRHSNEWLFSGWGELAKWVLGSGSGEDSSTARERDDEGRRNFGADEEERGRSVRKEG
jgi:hypothetical protein